MRKYWQLWIIGIVVAALMATDMLPMFAQAEEAAVTAVPVITTATERAETIIVAQQKKPRKRKTLMDLLFGNEEEQRREEAPVVETPAVVKPKAASLPPAKPAVEKAVGATRLAVFGDSMAVDLAKALERLHAEDPNLVIISQGVGSSGFVRPDFFDWNKTIGEQIAADSFDIAVVVIGINDRQTMKIDGKSFKSLTPEWTTEYTARVTDFVTQLRNANKPTIWVGLPPMEAPSYARAINQISEIQKLAIFSAGAEFLDIYERFATEEGKYTTHGPDLNGNRVRMRKDDGIHFSAAGADKLAFYLSQTLKLYYRGGGAVGVEVADPLLGTDAQLMVRPPYQGLGQIRLLEVAGAVISLTHARRRAADLVTAGAVELAPAFDTSLLIQAPVGRVDAFGVGKLPEAEQVNATGR
ncbi:MAG: SGNH/GDSL hydrolase family protein [Devosia sp.]